MTTPPSSTYEAAATLIHPTTKTTGKETLQTSLLTNHFEIITPLPTHTPPRHKPDTMVQREVGLKHGKLFFPSPFKTLNVKLKKSPYQ